MQADGGDSQPNASGTATIVATSSAVPAVAGPRTISISPPPTFSTCVKQRVGVVGNQVTVGLAQHLLSRVERPDFHGKYLDSWLDLWTATLNKSPRPSYYSDCFVRADYGESDQRDVYRDDSLLPDIPASVPQFGDFPQHVP